MQFAALRCTWEGVPAKLHRAPPYLILGLSLSLLLHGALALLSYIPALARRLLPRLPIEMTILPPKPRPQPAPAALAPPPPPAPPTPPLGDAKPGEAGPKPAPRKPVAKKAPTPPAPPKIAPMAGLGPSAIDRDIGVRVVLRMAQLRSSPHRPALLRLLAAFPDTHILAHGTSLPSSEALAQLLVTELQALLIATPDPSDLTATAFYGVAADTGRVQSVLQSRRQLPWDPRVLSTPRRGLLALARPDLLGPGTYTPPPPPGAPPGAPAPAAPPSDPGWPEKLRAALLGPGPAVSAEILNVHERVRLQGGLPTPTALRLAMSGEERPAVVLRLELRTAEEAARLAAVLPGLKEKMATYLFLIGLSGFFDELQLSARGPAVELSGRLPAKQIDILLGLLAQQLPPPSRFLPSPPPPPLDAAAVRPPPDAAAPPDAGVLPP